MTFADALLRLPALLPGLVELRHDLHRHPELGFEEHRTQQVVEARLAALGYAPRRLAGTGLIADLKGDGAPKIALRADLDALPIDERTPLPYRSIHAGRAHKCGHDGHTSILLGVAELLPALAPTLPFDVRLVFQPAEEGVKGGGARVMIAEGALEGVTEIYGLHSWPDFPKGEVRARPGPMMAQVHTFRVTLVGVGGHGSQPQLTKDPIVAGAALVTALQTIASRAMDQDGGAVVSVCQFQAGTTHNIIPATAELVGTIRTFLPAKTTRALERFDAIVAGVARAHEVEASVDLEVGYPVLVNDADCVGPIERAARSAGLRFETGGLPMAGGEDFAYYTQRVPGAYFFLGARRPGERTPVCHHPDFDFDDDLIESGVRMFLGVLADRAG